jgi:hypothetical protein
MRPPRVWRQLTGEASFKGPWLLLKNPWNLNSGQKNGFHAGALELAAGALVKESFQLFWTYKQPWRAKASAQWMNSAMRSAGPFKKFMGIFGLADGGRLDQDTAFKRRG